MTNMHFAQPEVLPEVAGTLFDRGYTEEQVRAVLGEKFMRVASATWQ